MKKHFFRLLFLLTIICISSEVNAREAVSVKVSLDSANLLMGNMTHLKVEVVQNNNTKGFFPVLTDNQSGYVGLCNDSVEMRTSYKADTVNLGSGRIQINYAIPLQAFDSGFYHLPELEYVCGSDTFLSNRVALKVVPVNVKADDPIAGFSLPSDPEEKSFFDFIPDWIVDWWWLILLILIIVGISVWIYLTRDKSAETKIIVPNVTAKPWEIALERLDGLRDKKLWENGREKEYFTELTDILREYLENRFGINAMEMTSRQIMDAVRNDLSVKDKRDYLRMILNMADFVKFAKVRPLPDDNILAFENALSFVKKLFRNLLLKMSRRDRTIQIKIFNMLKYPGFLFLFIIYIPLIWWYIKKNRASYPYIGVSTTSCFEKLPLSWKVYLMHACFVLQLAAIGCLIVALCRPQTHDHFRQSQIEGTDIVIALDISGSMSAKDFKPSRFVAAKEVAESFVNRRENDNMGLVVFAGESLSLMPLTDDRAAIINAIKNVEMGALEDGTAIGDGLSSAINRIASGRAKSKSIILLTDGANNSGDVPPSTAARIAAQKGIRIYTIGVGTDGSIVVTDPYGFSSTTIETKIDEESLKSIAKSTGGRYFRATDEKMLKDVFAEIDSLEKTKFDVNRYTQTDENFMPWVWSALALMIAMLLCRYLVLRRIP